MNMTQNYNPESDFSFTCENDNTAVIITDYTGTDKTVNIPFEICGLPVIEIGDEAFVEKGLTSVSIPNSVTRIGAYAFDQNQLDSFTIPDSVTYIGCWAFARNQLTSVTIPDGIAHIGESAFGENRLTSVTIPDSVV